MLNTAPLDHSLHFSIFQHLDDPLSAVDAHVGKHIFQEVMSNVDGILMKSTRILVTNAMQYVSSCDKVVVVDNGKIVASGSYTELKKDEKANVYRVIENL